MNLDRNCSHQNSGRVFIEPGNSLKFATMKHQTDGFVEALPRSPEPSFMRIHLAVAVAEKLLANYSIEQVISAVVDVRLSHTIIADDMSPKYHCATISLVHERTVCRSFHREMSRFADAFWICGEWTTCASSKERAPSQWRISECVLFGWLLVYWVRLAAGALAHIKCSCRTRRNASMTLIEDNSGSDCSTVIEWNDLRTRLTRLRIMETATQVSERMCEDDSLET